MNNLIRLKVGGADLSSTEALPHMPSSQIIMANSRSYVHDMYNLHVADISVIQYMTVGTIYVSSRSKVSQSVSS